MKKFKLIALAICSFAMTTSCLVDDEDETLEIFADLPYTVGFKNNVANESYFEDLGAIEAAYTVDIIGGQDGTPPTQDIVVNYTINEEESSASEGVEFDFVENTGQLVIPAGSKFGTFEILINTGNLNPNQPTVLILDLESVEDNAANIVTQNDLDKLQITFVGCNSQLAQPGNASQYFVELVREDGTTYSGEETIVWLGPNKFQTESTGVWGINTIAPDTSMDFEDICGEIFVPSQNLAQGFYSNEVFGINLTGPDGTVDQETLSFEMTYIITFGSGPLSHTVTYTKL